jgi:hypothetical protein
LPLSKYIRVTIDDQQLDLPPIEELPLSISYKLEDPEDFQRKKSSEAFDVAVPATVNNQRIANSFHNSSVEDLTDGEIFRSNRNAVIEANGYELLIGKAFLNLAKHNRFPTEYEYSFFGNNADWIIDLKEATLFDFLKDIQFAFTKQKIIDSWQYDGTDEELPYVFAPVRYGLPMDDYIPSAGVVPQSDRNMKPEYMRPALSKYWLLQRGFKSLGYKIQSDFLDSEYFRRQVMPWTWGNFLFSEGTRLNSLDFLAKSTEQVDMLNVDYTGYWDVKASNDSIDGAFDNNDVYSYSTPLTEMKWTYLPSFNYGSLEAHFYFNAYVSAVATANSNVELRIQWFKNGVRVINNINDNGNGTELVLLEAPLIGRRDYTGAVEDFFSAVVDPGDTISAKIYLHTFKSGAGIARIHLHVDAFELDYFRIPLGGLIDFSNYTGFKKHKFLDFVGGIVDEFNLQIQTDPVNKIVYIEPQHPYSLTNDFSNKSGGYFNGNVLNWEEKQDISKTSTMRLFSESERELYFRYKEDNNDGVLKSVQDRNLNKVAVGKYVFPDRFKAGKKEIVNRFFSAVMHYDVKQWTGFGTEAGDYPQMITLIPENISNTSRDEAQNTFEPKSAYYKGLITNVGWIFDGVIQDNFPFMFAVNYRTGGENDPILSYADESIGNPLTPVIGKGLLRRFYHQRLAIMRNGQYYTTHFRLNNNDVTNFLHREHIILQGQRWELVEINNYKPLKEESTECLLRKWSPITNAG